MVEKRGGRQRQRMYPDDIVVTLSSGHDFFGQLRGGIAENLDLLRQAWQDLDIREQVEERRLSRGQGPSFAELHFDEGLSVRSARRQANGFSPEDEREDDD